MTVAAPVKIEAEEQPRPSRFPIRRYLADVLLAADNLRAQKTRTFLTALGIVFGVGFFWLFLIVDWPGAMLRNSLWGELLALSVRNMTLSYIIIAPALARISPELAKAASTSGAATGRTALSITRCRCWRRPSGWSASRRMLRRQRCAPSSRRRGS